MTAAQLLLAALLGLQRYAGDTETAAMREQRLSTVSVAILDAGEHAACTGAYKEDTKCHAIWPDARSMQMLLVTEGYFETHFAQHVHEGRCNTAGGECDGGQARSPWQLHLSGLVPWAVWSKIGDASETSTRLSAWSAAQVLAVGLQRCKSIEGAISLYATGSICRWYGAKARRAFYQRLIDG